MVGDSAPAADVAGGVPAGDADDDGGDEENAELPDVPEPDDDGHVTTPGGDVLEITERPDA